jgi:dTDP-glucose 4,6-dehydratase
MNKTILITGGAGFIGSHVVNYFTDKYPETHFIVIDSLTYASNLKNIMQVEGSSVGWKPNMTFWNTDIRNVDSLQTLFKSHNIDGIIHLAAESHVDNSIKDPNIFVETNVIGTLNLLNVAKEFWGEGSENRFHHVSTDEVYGDLTLDEQPFVETTPYDPSSPYSASKAASDHFVRAYGRTYGMNITISNCSNNYGPHQHAEKLIPVVIKKLMHGEKIPVYGKGENVRDWLWVGDHVTAIDEIFHNGKKGHTYNVGGDNELTNIELIYKICELFNNLYKNVESPIVNLPDFPIKFVTDRKGHDLRYAVNSNKLQTNLNWKPEKKIYDGLLETIEYYVRTKIVNGKLEYENRTINTGRSNP